MIVGTILVLVPYDMHPTSPSSLVTPCAEEAKKCGDECFEDRDTLIPLNSAVSFAGANSTFDPCLDRCPDPHTCMPQNDTGLNALLTKLKQDGFSVTFETIRVIEEVEGAISVVYGVYRKGIFVGKACLTTGPGKSIPFAVVEWANQTRLYLYEDGGVQQTILSDNPESRWQIQKVSCKDLCHTICGSGGLVYVAVCLTDCAASGGAYPLCVGLCNLIAGLTCLLSCDRICDLI